MKTIQWQIYCMGITLFNLIISFHTDGILSKVNGIVAIGFFLLFLFFSCKSPEGLD
jgi:hypothetical protein